MFNRIATVAALLCLVTSSCSVDLGGGPDRPRLSGERARIVAEFDAEPHLLSPMGDALLIETETDTAAGAMCVVELEDEIERFCLDDPQLVVSIGSQDWSSDGSELVLASRPNPDVFIVDMATGVVDPITDDGVWETLPEDVGKGPIDELPVFTPSHGGIVFFRESVTGERSLMLFDRSDRELVGQVELPANVTRSYVPPLVLDDRRALVGGADTVFEIDFDSGTLTEVFDYSSTFEPEDEAIGFTSTRVLAPVDELDDGRLVLHDPGTITVLNMTGGGHGGYSSGAYLGDPADGTLVPIFETGTRDEGWLGPLALVPAGENQYVVSWLDATGEVEALGLGFVTTLSLLDLDEHELPIDPNRLPRLWNDMSDESLRALSPAPGYTIALSDRSTLAVQTWGGRTIVLEFPHEQLDE